MVVIVPLPRTCSCKVSVQCSCILQTPGGPSWPCSYYSQEPAAVRCRYNVVVFYKHEGAVVAVIVPLPRTCSCEVSVQCSCILQTRGGPSWPSSYHCQEPAAVRCRYNVVVFYKHEGCRRGCDHTTPKNQQL